MLGKELCKLKIILQKHRTIDILLWSSEVSEWALGEKSEVTVLKKLYARRAL